MGVVNAFLNLHNFNKEKSPIEKQINLKDASMSC